MRESISTPNFNSFQGNVLKKRIHSRRSPRKETPQLRTLKKLLVQAKSTRFGKSNDFKKILHSEDIELNFRNRIPLTSYDAMYEQCIKHAMNGMKGISWPGQIQYFAMSSGTTRDHSKYIPVSDEMLKQFQRSSYRQLVELTKSDLDRSVYKSKVLTIGGSTELQKHEFCKVGDLSGILSKKKSWAFSPIAKPGKKISMLKDWDEKINRIVKKAPRWNIGVIAGVPSWVVKLLEQIVAHYQVNNIHEIWPNLQLYLHGGVFLEPYQERLDKLMGKPIVYQNTFLASEGYFGYQKDFDSEYMELLTNNGVYFEFIEERYFNQVRNNNFYNVKTVTLDEVRPNTVYSMVISTCSGLWRYSMGDLVVFDDTKRNTFKLVGRIAYDLNISGEHLTEEVISKAVLEVSKHFGSEIHEFCVYPNRKTDRHEWYIGPDRNIPEQEFTAMLDARLKEMNHDYAVVRRYHLKAPRVKVLPTDKFYEYLYLKDNYGAQNKFPRVMNTIQIKEWESYLSNSDVFRKSLGA